MIKPVGKDDYKFIVICFLIALFSFSVCLLFKGPGVIPAILMSAMILSIGCGGLRLMHVIRDL